MPQGKKKLVEKDTKPEIDAIKESVIIYALVYGYI